MRMAAVETAPVADTRRDFISVTSTHEARQKKMYGISVAITEIVASWSKWLEKSRSAALVAQPAIRADAGVPRWVKSWIFGTENWADMDWSIREVPII